MSEPKLVSYKMPGPWSRRCQSFRWGFSSGYKKSRHFWKYYAVRWFKLWFWWLWLFAPLSWICLGLRDAWRYPLLNFKFYEGSPVTSVTTGVPLKDLKDIQEGSEIFVAYNTDDGVRGVGRAVVKSVNYEEGTANADAYKTPWVSYGLKFNKDDRKCWVCWSTMIINPKLLEKVKFF